MRNILDALKTQAGLVDRTLGQPRFGTVTSFDTANYTARVLLQPEGTVTGWLPVLSAWTGPGWGMIVPLAAGDQVLVLPQEGDAEHGVIVGRAFSNICPAPPATAGEFWIIHPSGSCLKLKNDGTVTIAGDLHVAGDVYDRHGSLSHLRGSYNAHVHTEQTSGQTTSPNIVD